MDLPVVVPWEFCWIGALGFCLFAVLSLRDMHSREPHASHKIFFGLAVIGFLVMIAPVVVNFAVLGWRVLIDALTRMHAAFTPRTY